MLTKWKEGIPSYKDTDLLTKNDIYKMAVDYVSEYEEGNIKLLKYILSNLF